MKLLSAVRHGKAERPDGYPRDEVRPLSERGHRDAALMGGILASTNPTVDWIISSPALRTRQTTGRIVKALDFERQVVWDDQVYEASPDALLKVLKVVPPDVEHVVLIGHNPGMEKLVSGLCAGAPDRLGITMATGATAFLLLEIFRWDQIRWGCGALQALLKPKLLRALDD